MTDSINKDMNLGFQFLDLTNIPDEEANRIKNVLKDNSRDRPVFFLQDQYKWKEKDKQETQQDYEEQEEPNVVEDNQKDSNITPGSTLVHEYQQLPVENVLQDNFHPQYPVSCVATPVMPPGFYPQMPNILVNTVSPSLQSIPYVMPHVRPYTDQEKIQAEQKVPGYTHGPPPFVSPAFVPQTVFHPNHPTPQSVTGAPYIIQTPYYVTMTPYTPPTTSVLTGVGKPASTSKYNKKDKPKDVKLVAEHRYVEKEKEKYGNEKEITQKDNTMEATNIATTQELKVASLSNGFPDEAEEAKNEVKCSSVSNETGFEATEEVKEVKAEQHLSSVFPPARKRNDNPVEVGVDPTPSEPVAPAPKSWASLFKAPAVSKVSTEPVPPPVQTPPAVTPPPANCDPDTYKLAMHLNNYALVHEGLNLQPRGLLNKGNYCYINAVLQGLMGCPPFYNMIRAIEPIVKMKDASAKPTPVMETLVSFVNEFVTLPPPVSPNPKAKKSIKPSTEISHGLPFEPSIVYSLMQTFNAFKEMGRQEDAEELLTVLLNALNDEMIEFVKLVSKPVQNGIDKPVENGNVEEPEEWQVIGPKNKGTVTRSATICRTPVGDLFLGQMRSVLQTEKGMCTATLQPFFTLQLDIQNEKVNTVNEALDMLVVKEPLVGYIDPKNKKEISASRQTTLEALPPVLMLHLKCFLYDKHGGCQKLMKKIDFPLELEIPRDVLSSNIKAKMSNKQRNYKLFAVIYHDGKEATKGHYVADVYHPELQRWIRYDDAAIKVVDEKTLLRHSPPRVPYLLFYRRKEF